jgi:glucosylceramidase
VHWYGSDWNTNPGGMDAIHAVNPNKFILFTEGCADGMIFGPNKGLLSQAPWWQKDDWFWTKVNCDWGCDWAPGPAHVPYHSVYRYIRDIISGLNHWYAGWVDWNGVLNKFGAQAASGGGIGTFGQPGVSHILNGTPAPIMVDEANPNAATIYYTPIYYAMRHFSKYIQPGAKILATTVAPAAGVTATDYDNAALPDGVAMYAVGALNPDGTTAVVVFNQTGKPIDYTLKVGTQQVDSTAPAQSLQTLLWH